MKILVTGGAGFIGSHIAEALLLAGHTVDIIDNLSSGFRANLPAGAGFIQDDILHCHTALESKPYDVVYHLAAQMDVRRSVDDPIYDASVNILGSIQLLEYCVRTGVKKFIFASSGGAGYGEQEHFPADETHPLHPLSPYGITKITVERYLYYYHYVHRLQYVSLRYANVYGPKQNPHGEAGVVAIFVNKMLNNELPIINGNGSQTRDYVHVQDVVAANLLALNEANSLCYNVSTAIETSVTELFSLLNELFDNKYLAQHAPAKAGEQQRSVLSYQALQNAHGWQPTVTLKQGLKSVIEFANK